MGRIRKQPLATTIAALTAALLAGAPAAVADEPSAGPCAGGVQPAGVDPRGAATGSPNPLKGLSFFVDPEEYANVHYRSFMQQGMQREAELMSRVAREPRFKWFGRWTRHGPALVDKVRAYIDRVHCTQPGAVPLMTVMRHQGKACNPRYTAGGPAEDQRHRLWIDRFARAIGNNRVVIAYEPDSLGTIECLAKHRRKSRLRNLRYGIDVLSTLPNATIYLEGGASDWESARRTARQLRSIGIHKVRGFMLNVTHYDWTRDNIRHGLKISRRVGGKPFIVSTSFNGRGPVHVWKRLRGKRRRLNVWCHPQKRGLGPAPTTDTSHPKVDAYMWIGRPGYSGGSCNGGPLPVGTFWATRALMFGTYATDWERPPSGTRNGHHRRFSPRQLGYCGGRCT